MLDEMKKVVGELYELYGATSQVVRLSELLDYYVYIEQRKQMSNYKKEYEEISELYDLSLDRLVSLYKRLNKLQEENENLQKRVARAEGKLDEARNIYRIVTGREDI